MTVRLKCGYQAFSTALLTSGCRAELALKRSTLLSPCWSVTTIFILYCTASQLRRWQSAPSAFALNTANFAVLYCIVRTPEETAFPVLLDRFKDNFGSSHGIAKYSIAFYEGIEISKEKSFINLVLEHLHKIAPRFYQCVYIILIFIYCNNQSRDH